MLLILSGLVLLLPIHLHAQNQKLAELEYEVNKIYAPLSVSKAQVEEAKTISDINPHYKPSWVEEYRTVEIRTSHNGLRKSAMSKDNMLTSAQTENMLNADYGSEIEFLIHYIPNNTLKEKELRLMDFKFTVNPELRAEFPGGNEALMHYLRQNAIDKIPSGAFDRYQLAAVRFQVNAEGEVIEPEIFWSSEDEEVDRIMLDVICDMPAWKPAQYSNGEATTEEYAFTVGDMESCVVNMLDLRRK